MRVACISVLTVLAAAIYAGPAAWAAPAEDETPWLGVVISDGIHGVRVRELIPQAPADDAGVQPGDEIIEVAGRRVDTVSALQTEITTRRVLDEVPLTVWRHGASVVLTAVLSPKLSAGEILYRRLIGQSAPEFDLPAVTRTAVSAREHIRGRVVVLSFFATNCTECAPVHQRLSRLVDERGRDGLSVLAISREPRSMLDTWVTRMVPSFDVLHDRHGNMASAYRVEQVPALVVINRDGEVCYAGSGDADNLDNVVFAAERALRRSESYWSR